MELFSSSSFCSIKLCLLQLLPSSSQHPLHPTHPPRINKSVSLPHDGLLEFKECGFVFLFNIYGARQHASAPLIIFLFGENIPPFLQRSCDMLSSPLASAFLQFQSLRARCSGLNTGRLRLGTCRERTSCRPSEGLGCQAPWVNGGTEARKGIAYSGREHVGSKWDKRDFRLDSKLVEGCFSMD